MEHITTSTQERMLERNMVQYRDAMRYREWAEKVEGRELTDTEVAIWYTKIGFASMFSVAWREGQEPLNLYYTGLEIGRTPEAEDGWHHLRCYWLTLVISRERLTA